MRVKTLIALMLSVVSLNAIAQQSPYTKFGKVSVTDLQKKSYAIDTSASSVVLSDIGHVQIKGNRKGFFSLALNRHKVIHVLSKSGYDMANIEISLYRSDDDREEKLESVKAITYNLENGKIKETKFDKSGIFTDKVNKNWVIKKFTMPNVKEGSIIEIEYEVSSDFLRHVDPWSFQGEAPRLWSEFIFSAPSFFRYTFLSHGYNKFFLQDRRDKVENFSVTIEKSIGGIGTTNETVNFPTGVSDFRWVMKDVPGLKVEKYTSALVNHTSRIEFQLASQTDPLESRSYIETWKDLTKELIASEYFGKAYEERETWVPGDFVEIFATVKKPREQAEKIYEYVRDGFVCTGNRGIYLDASMKNVLKSKKGTTAELNLLLTGLLRHAGLTANPIILSTAENGFAYQEYASLAQFNYVIVQLELEGKKYYLDASYPMMGFGKLLPKCYNGHARVVNEEATAVYLMPESVTEKKVTTLFISNGKDGKMLGTLKQYPGYFESYYDRQKIAEVGEQEFLKSVEQELGGDVKISKSQIDSLKKYNSGLQLIHELEMSNQQPDIIYFNPLFGERFSKNPFESANRLYPVEMPYLVDETFALTMEVPAGYVVDELPKQTVIKVDNAGTGQFEYRIAQTGQTISLRMILKFTKTNYSPEEYNSLRDFFGLIVSKQAEQIVFKKKQ